MTEMRAWWRLKGREQAWAYTDKKTKEQYIRVAIKKLDEENPDFEFMNAIEQLEAIVDRAKKIAVDQANDENTFVAMDAEGNVLDEEGNVDPEAEHPNRPNTFRDGSQGEIGETREHGRFAKMAESAGGLPKRFGSRRGR